MKEFVCFNSKYLPGYSLIDKSSARLRVPSQLISSLNSDGKSSSDSSSTSKSSGVAPKGSLMEMLQKNKSNFSSSSSSSSSSSKNCSKIHSFVKLKLFYQDKEEEKNIIIYATLWPDDQNALQENQTALDAVVFEGENIPEIMKNSNWFEGKIQILENLPYKPCSSIVYTLEDYGPQIRIPSSALILSYPVKAPCVINVEFPKIKSFNLTVKKSNPEGYGIIELNSLMIKDTNSSLENKKDDEKKLDEKKEIVSESKNSISYANTKIVQELYNKLILPILNNVPYSLLIKGVMMTGPPGVGKTFSLKALKHIVKDICDIYINEISIPELLSESEPLDLLNKLLANKKDKSYNSDKPVINFYLMDEIDALGDSRSNNETQIAIKQRLIEWFKDENLQSNPSSYSCLVSTSNHINDIDISLRRGGRFELEIILNSSSMDRNILLNKYLKDLHQYYVEKNKNFSISNNIFESFEAFFISLTEQNIENISKELSQKTGGYVATDLSVLIREFQFQLLSKKSVNIQKNYNENDLLFEKIKENINLYDIYKEVLLKYDVKFDDNDSSYQFFFVKVIESLMKIVLPSCLRGISINIPQNLTLNDVIGNDIAKKELVKVISSVCDLNMRKKLLNFGLIKSLNSYPSLGGILLYGLPGNSKTFLTKCIASTYNLPLLTLNCAQLFSMYVGESERELRNVFIQARQAAPCILFLDEIDTLVGTNTTNGSGGVESRVMSTLLNELDGVGSNSASANGVIIIGATNRIDTLDAALIRKGRFYKCIEIKSPEGIDQINLIKYFCSKFKIINEKNREEEEEIINIIKNKLTPGISGAQIENLCKELALEKLNNIIKENNT